MQCPIVLSLHKVSSSWDFPWIYLEVIIISPLSCCFAKMYIACSFNLSISIKPSCYLIIIAPPLWTPSNFSISSQWHDAQNSAGGASCTCSCVEKVLCSSALLQSILNWIAHLSYRLPLQQEPRKSRIQHWRAVKLVEISSGHVISWFPLRTGTIPFKEHTLLGGYWQHHSEYGLVVASLLWSNFLWQHHQSPEQARLWSLCAEKKNAFDFFLKLYATLWNLFWFTYLRLNLVWNKFVIHS